MQHKKVNCINIIKSWINTVNINDAVNIIRHMVIANRNMKEKIQYQCELGNECYIHGNNIRSQYICFSNVHTLLEGRKNKKYRYIINNSAMSLPDGMPLVWIGRKRGYLEMSRCAGNDVMNEVLKLSEKEGYTNFFYGCSPDTLNKLYDRLKKTYPRLKIAGMYSPPYTELSSEQDKKIVDYINKAAPDILWVGLGAPKQEIWMAEHADKIKGTVMLGVGAAFNFQAGTLKRAPVWMQKAGLEWLYRLIKEPKRLFKRYAVGNILFLYYLIQESILRMTGREKN